MFFIRNLQMQEARNTLSEK